MKKLLLSTVLALGITSGAQAETLTMTEFGVIGGVNGTFGPPLNESVQAGQIALTGPGGNLLVWCLDLNDILTKPYTFNVNTFTAGDIRPGLGQLSLLDGSALRQIASLMLNGIDFQNDGLSRAATQLAIWKIEYGALFDPLNLDATLTADMNAHILASVIGGLIDCSNCTLKVLTDAPVAPNQALGFAVVEPVPLPATVWLFGGALAGLGALMRRRKQTSVVA